MTYFDPMYQYGYAPGGMWSNFNFTFTPTATNPSTSTEASASTEASEELSGNGGQTSGSGFINETGDVNWAEVHKANLTSKQIIELINESNKQKEAIEKLRKAEEENKKLLLQQYGDTTAIKDTVANVRATASSIEKTKAADGTAFKKDVDLTPPSKKSWWQSVKDWGKNTWKACEKVWDGMTKDEKGNWNLGKCLKSAAIVGAVWVAPRVLDLVCPGLGVAVTTGLVATGVASGIYETTTGAIDLNKANKNYEVAYNRYTAAKTPEQKEAALQEVMKAQEEIDKAQQKTSMGVIVGGTSLLGLRSIGRAARAGAIAEASGGASAAARTTEQAAQIVQNAGYKMSTGVGSGIKNFFYDISVNAYKGTKAQMAATRAAASGTTISGRIKSLFSKNSTLREDMLNKSKDLYTNGARVDKTETALGDGIASAHTDIQSMLKQANMKELMRKVRLGEASDAEKMMYQTLKEAYGSLSREIDSFGTTTMSKAEYQQLLAEGGSKGIQAVENAIDDLKALEELVAANPAEAAAVRTQINNLQHVLKGTYKANLGKLVNLKDANMKYMADNMKTAAGKAGGFETQLEKYMPEVAAGSKPSGYWNWGKNKYQVEYLNNGWTRNGKFGMMKPMKYLKPAKWAMWDAPMIPMNLAVRPIGTAWKVWNCTSTFGLRNDSPFYSPLGDYIAKDEVDYELNVKSQWREQVEKNLAVIDKVKSGEDTTTKAEELQAIMQETNQLAEFMKMSYGEYMAYAQQQQAAQQQATQQATQEQQMQESAA